MIQSSTIKISYDFDKNMDAKLYYFYHPTISVTTTSGNRGKMAGSGENQQLFITVVNNCQDMLDLDGRQIEIKYHFKGEDFTRNVKILKDHHDGFCPSDEIKLEFV